MTRNLALLFLVATACTPAVTVRWADLGSLPATTEADAHDYPAVVLLAEDHSLLDNDLPAKWVRMRHMVIRILTDEGRRHYSHWHVPVGSEEKLASIQARTISPDGSIHPMADADFIQDQITRIHDETSADEEKEVATPVVAFPFPDVEVGATLEYSYVVQNSRQWQRSVNGMCASELPIRRCDVEVLYANGIHGELQTYNTDAKPIFERADSELWRARLSVTDVPAWPDEPFRRGVHRRDPWWEFRVRYVSDHGGVDPVLAQWSDAARFIADEWMANNDKYLDGFTTTLPKDGCKDKACLVARAVELVRDHTDLAPRAHVDDIRPLKAVWEGGSADPWEKALLTWQLLTSAGVDVRLAVSTLPDDKKLDRTAPSSTWFDHALVYVPPEGGSGAGTWIDPSCESCAPGQLPARRLGGDALVIDAKKDLLRKVTLKTEFLKVEGEAAPISQVSTSFEVRPGANGDAVADIERSQSGRSALEERMRTRGFDAESRANDDAEFAVARLSTARVKSAEPIHCDKATSRCDRKISLNMPALGISTPTAIAFPLSIFPDAYGNVFRKPTRVDDIQFRTSEEITDTASFTRPEGSTCAWQPASAEDGPYEVPESRERKSSAAEVQVKVELNGDRVTVTRSLSIQAGIYPRADYDAIRGVFRDFDHVRREAVICKQAAPIPAPVPAIAPAGAMSAMPGTPAAVAAPAGAPATAMPSAPAATTPAASPAPTSAPTR
jgi:hypothetical protein